VPNYEFERCTFGGLLIRFNVVREERENRATLGAPYELLIHLLNGARYMAFT
jgi:hypothetical protein